MSILIERMSKKDFEEILKYARYGANNCMIGERAVVVELPPHGRLIDADALKELYDLGEELDYCHVTLPLIRQNIEDMPTIIEAEEVAS